MTSHPEEERVLQQEPEASLHWLVMQSMKHKKWVLAVMWGNFSEYRVTDMMSENVDKVIQYADYLNRGAIGPSLDQRSIAALEKLKNDMKEGVPG
ncbi:MAG: hypothetical protein SOX32_04590 [Candidatus Choladocola sp.]|nr:hypothetical protein [Candidatus Choladocola sp.]